MQAANLRAIVHGRTAMIHFHAQSFDGAFDDKWVRKLIDCFWKNRCFSGSAGCGGKGRLLSAQNAAVADVANRGTSAVTTERASLSAQ